MKYIVLDFETSNYNYGTAFDPRNFPVALVLLYVNNKERRILKYHFLSPEFFGCKFNEIALILKENKDVPIIGHNLHFDIHWLDRLEIEHGSNLYDTMFLPYLQQEGRKGKLTLSHLSHSKDKLGDLLVHKHGLDPSLISPKLILDYCVKDVLATEKLCIEQYKNHLGTGTGSLFGKPLKLMCDLLPIIIKMEGNGFQLDLKLLEKIYEEQLQVWDKLIYDVEETILSVYGIGDFNVNSSQQKSEFIYSLKLIKEKKPQWAQFFENFNPFQKRAESIFHSELNVCFIKTGFGLGFTPRMEAIGKVSLSTDIDCLKELVRNNKEHDQIKLLEKFYAISRQKTLISTFIEGILGGGPKNKEPKYFFKAGRARLHTNYNQTITGTGRLSSSKPNLQNWPREGTFPIRRCIISRFEGGSIASADASQIELRYSGWYYDDAKMREDYQSGVDIHGNLASMVYGTDFSDDNRTDSKSVIFRILYRGGPRGILLDPRIPIYDLEEIKSIIEAIYGRYKQLKEGQERDYDYVTTQGNGLLSTPTGRRFRFNLTRFNLKNKIANYPIQSGATADFIPCAMIACDKFMIKEEVRSLMIGQVHDEIIFDTYPGEERIMKTIAGWALTEGGRREFNKRFGINFDFPLESSWKIKKHW